MYTASEGELLKAVDFMHHCFFAFITVSSLTFGVLCNFIGRLFPTNFWSHFELCNFALWGTTISVIIVYPLRASWTPPSCSTGRCPLLLMRNIFLSFFLTCVLVAYSFLKVCLFIDRSLTTHIFNVARRAFWIFKRFTWTAATLLNCGFLFYFLSPVSSFKCFCIDLFPPKHRCMRLSVCVCVRL